jgi:hypothetical protein
VIEFDLDNSEKVFSIAASVIALLGAIIGVRRYMGRRGISEQSSGSQSPSIAQSPSIVQAPSINVSIPFNSAPLVEASSSSINEYKRSKSILFIDDDRDFKIAEILKKMGWINAKLIRDVRSLEDRNIVDSDVLFIDIQGVGRLMQLREEGLGLALAVKRRYPEKKVIIYSAQEDGKRFHEALNEADYSLPKNAEPIRFEEAIIRVVKK